MKQFKLYKHIKKIISYCIIAFFLIGTVGCQKINRFETSDEVDFYVLGSDGIIGYQFNDEKLNEITKTDIKIINTNINPVVHRSELLNQYLVFTEEDFPGRDKQSLVSIDFNTGLIHRYCLSKTNNFHCWSYFYTFLFIFLKLRASFKKVIQ